MKTKNQLQGVIDIKRQLMKAKEVKGMKRAIFWLGKGENVSCLSLNIAIFGTVNTDGALLVREGNTVPQ